MANGNSKQPALVVEDVHKRFGDLEVLKGISLTANEHDVISIIGSSGSGKSTFLRCINLLEMPDSGRIVVADEEIRLRRLRDGRAVPESQKQVDRIRSRVGMVFQSFNLWSHMTVLQNVIEAPIHVLKLPRKEAVERAEELLDKVGHRRQEGPVSGPSFRRSATAMRDRPNPGDGTEAVVVRRSDIGAGSGTGWRGPARDP